MRPNRSSHQLSPFIRTLEVLKTRVYIIVLKYHSHQTAGTTNHRTLPTKDVIHLSGAGFSSSFASVLSGLIFRSYNLQTGSWQHLMGVQFSRSAIVVAQWWRPAVDLLYPTKKFGLVVGPFFKHVKMCQLFPFLLALSDLSSEACAPRLVRWKRPLKSFCRSCAPRRHLQLWVCKGLCALRIVVVSHRYLYM